MLAEVGTPFVVVTLARVEGHVPQDPGAKALIGEGGLISGTVGGGKLEARAIDVAREMLVNSVSRPELLRLDLQTDLGMTCGGSATLLFEPVLPCAWTIAVFGAGHVAQATIPLLATLPCVVHVVDHRTEMLDALAFSPRVRRTAVAGPDDYAGVVTRLPPGTSYVIMTRGHATDLPVLAAVLRRGDAAYVGVIGSVVKARSLRAALVRDGVVPQKSEQLEFQCPMGLDLGTNSPPEIAISIAAQLLLARGQKQ